MNHNLFSEQVLKFLFRRTRLVTAPGALSSGPEVLAEIGPFLVGYRFRHCFPALPIGGRIIKNTVQADMQVFAAMGTFIPKPYLLLGDQPLAS